MAEEQQTDQTTTTSGISDDDLLGAFGGEVEGGDQPAGEPQTPASQPQFMSADQVTQLLNNQTQMIAEHIANVNRPAAPQSQPQPEEPEPQSMMPTDREVREAFESGDGDAFMQVYARSLNAVHLANEQRIQRLERQGAQRMQQLAQETVRDAIPDDYRDAVNEMMDELNMAPELRTNRQVLGILADAARGRNLDNEVNSAIEARVRRAAQQRQGGEPTTSRTARGQEPDEPTFSLAAMQALRNAGRSPDRHAQQLGYENWEAYERATADKYTTWRDRSVPAWRQRLNERRQATGRRRSV